MKDEIRMALCEVVVRGTKHCSPNCRCLKACYCWRGFTQAESPEEIKVDSKGRVIRRKACIDAENAAKRKG